MIQRPSDYLLENNMPSNEMLASVMSEFIAVRRDMKRMRSYYDGDMPIKARSRSSGLPNNRLAYPYARYITAITSGYLAGNPVSYTTASEAQDTLDTILRAYKVCSMTSVDTELARNAAIYGKGVEYLTLDDGDDVAPKSTSLSPEQAFVVYDDTHDMKPLFGVYFAVRRKETGDGDGVNIWIMSDSTIRLVHAAHESASSYELISEQPHYFGGVPLIEYWNDENERSDLKGITDLIDAYNLLQSDRMNDIEQFVDSLLVLTGCTLGIDERGRTPGQQLREDKALSLPDGDAKAEYLTHALNEADIEIMRTALKEDIHKMSLVPDLSDQNFAANASGVAMRYKLWGLEQLTNVKEQWFIEGLRTRLKLFTNIMAVRGQQMLDVSEVEITMTRSLPANDLENVQIAQTARNAGAGSTRTLVKVWHPDWSDETIDAEVEAIAVEEDQKNAFDARVNDLLTKDDMGGEE